MLMLVLCTHKGMKKKQSQLKHVLDQLPGPRSVTFPSNERGEERPWKDSSPILGLSADSCQALSANHDRRNRGMDWVTRNTDLISYLRSLRTV